MNDNPTNPTILLPEGPATTDSGRTGLPDDMLTRARHRLRRLAIVYALTFLMADFGSAALIGELSRLLVKFVDWGPAAISIGVALLVVALSYWPRISNRALMNVGLGFQVVGSFGIAMAEYWGSWPNGLDTENGDGVGLSWVAVWMVFYTIVVPSVPWKALLAALGSAAAVPVTIFLSMKYGGTILSVTPGMYFVGLIFPYLLVAAMAFAGAHTVYRLGREVRRAREYGSYRLVELLGRGGMGEVWRAEHQMLVRPAAIKLISPDALGDPRHHDTVVTRFKREAQATANLCSPHTVELYDFGVAGNGAFYYVMELLRGLDLQTLVSRFGSLPPARVVHLLLQVCHSLGEAHEKGLIHRDIKPANLYACRHGRDVDFMKVLDFGLVKARDTAADDLFVTAQAVAGGTPAFMAPEQILGDRPVDGRSDLYALGCVAYWLLTGSRVFEAETAMKTMMLHSQAPPLPPSQRSEIPIPPSLEEVVMMCLEKDPDRRPSSADALRDALTRCDLEPSWSPSQATEWWRLHVPG